MHPHSACSFQLSTLHNHHLHRLPHLFCLIDIIHQESQGGARVKHLTTLTVLTHKDAPLSIAGRIAFMDKNTKETSHSTEHWTEATKLCRHPHVSPVSAVRDCRRQRGSQCLHLLHPRSEILKRLILFPPQLTIARLQSITLEGCSLNCERTYCIILLEIFTFD